MIDALALPDLPITAVHHVRNVANRKEMFCVSFALPEAVVFDETGENGEERGTAGRKRAVEEDGEGLRCEDGRRAEKRANVGEEK